LSRRSDGRAFSLFDFELRVRDRRLDFTTIFLSFLERHTERPFVLRRRARRWGSLAKRQVKFRERLLQPADCAIRIRLDLPFPAALLRDLRGRFLEIVQRERCFGTRWERNYVLGTAGNIGAGTIRTRSADLIRFEGYRHKLEQLGGERAPPGDCGGVDPQ
jgi:hypothetical protein